MGKGIERVRSQGDMEAVGLKDGMSTGEGGSDALRAGRNVPRGRCQRGRAWWASPVPVRETPLWAAVAL